MNRKKELQVIKQLIKKYYNDATCGLYNTRNIVGDYMCNIFKGKYFILDICYGYSYFEVFGTTTEEFNELEKFYRKLRREEERK